MLYYSVLVCYPPVCCVSTGKNKYAALEHFNTLCNKNGDGTQRECALSAEA